MSNRAASMAERILKETRGILAPPASAASRVLAALTVEDLLSRAENAIERDESFVYDVAAETGQMVGNVKHMPWFVEAVANWLIDNTGRWSRLPRFN